MRERFSYDGARDHLPPYFGEAFDKQYCEMLLADAAEADLPTKGGNLSVKERTSFFKMAGNFLIKSWRSVRPNSHISAAKKSPPAP
jgi:hypothetical protein